MSMHHSFDVSIAKEYGVPVATFLNNIVFWIHKNIANRKHFHNGRYWTYNTSEALAELFPYWSTDQIDRIIKKCVDSGLLLTDNFNKTKFDRTRWFSLTDKGNNLYKIIVPQNGGMETESSTNTNREIAEPIPDINTDTKTDKRKSVFSLNEKEPKGDYQEAYRKYSKPKLVSNPNVEYAKKPILPEYTGGGYKCAPNGEIPKDSPLYEFMQRNQQPQPIYTRKVTERVDVYG